MRLMLASGRQGAEIRLKGPTAPVPRYSRRTRRVIIRRDCLARSMGSCGLRNYTEQGVQSAALR